MQSQTFRHRTTHPELRFVFRSAFLTQTIAFLTQKSVFIQNTVSSSEEKWPLCATIMDRPKRKSPAVVC